MKVLVVEDDERTAGFIARGLAETGHTVDVARSGNESVQMGMAGELREIVDEADNRPMRVLDYRTPAEAFADELLELQDQQGVLHL